MLVLERLRDMTPDPDGCDPHADPAGEQRPRANSVWDGLADVSASAAEHLWRDTDGEIAQFIAAEHRGHTWIERLVLADAVRLECLGALVVEGTVAGVYSDCIVLALPAHRAVVFADAVVAAFDLPMRVGPPVTVLGAELSATSAVSEFIGTRVDVHRRDGRILSGDVTAVWRDCIDICTRTGALSVPLGAIAGVIASI